MKSITIHLTVAELQTLTTISENELFRMKYINTRLPGYVENPEMMRIGQSAVRVFSEALKQAKGFPLTKAVSN